MQRTLIIFSSGTVKAYSPLQKETDRYGYELELDAYYTCFEFYVPFRRQTREKMKEESELNMYKALFEKSIVPNFFVIEPSVYPFPCLGVYLKEHQRDFYNSGKISKNFNLIKSICAGFQEPWALTFFLGNLVSFKIEDTDEGQTNRTAPEAGKTLRKTGKAYLGYMFSFGGGHIQDNVLIDDRWFEVEWKIKGDRITPERKMTWSFRIGGKSHSNPYIKDVLYFSIRRDRIDYNFYELSLLKNSSIEYTLDFDTEFKNIIRHYFLVGKSFPFKNSRLTFQLHFGFIKEEAEKYTGPLKRTDEEENFYFVVRPNLKF